MIRLETDYPAALDSPDHIAPVGTVNDNTTDIQYIEAIKKYFKKSPLKVLDLGCAGGQLIADFISMGDYAVGLEGSPLARKQGAGKHNWDKYGDKNLFTVDLTKPYQLYDENEKVEFDLITTWEVIEHIAEEDLEMFFSNIKNHLKDDGVLCCSIAVVRDDVGYLDGKLISRHQSVFNPAKWINILFDNGFELAIDPNWPAAPAGLEHPHHPEKPQGVVANIRGLFFGYLFGNAMFRNHQDMGNSIYFCLKNKT
jgi:SAM-dependent methyltransferase